MRPSSVSAAFNSTNGRPRRAAVRKRAFWASASDAQTPVVTATPARRSSRSPRPLTRGSGSRSAATTRAMPAATTSGAQGGVRPWCEQGSSVT